MFYPSKKLVNYFFKDFVIKLYLFKTKKVNDIKCPCRFGDIT